MARLNVLQSDPACGTCLKSYARKHDFKQGDSFDIECKGIPLKYVSDATTAFVSGDMNPELLLDPVKWASEVLDWHCLDPDGAVWARKDPAEYAEQMAKNPNRVSKYHRPYQATMLRCSSQFKILRIGRRAGKTESIAISILFHIFTNTNFKVILITPFQSQIDLVFKRIEELLNSSSLVNSVRRSVKAPQYTIELYNGSHIKGFTAGTKSGSGAASARGQDANLIVFDEADYLDRSDIDASMAIIADHPDAVVWMSSTPTGRREKFYEISLDRTWKEFHYPSHINPNWSEKLDALFKTNLTSIGYKHEILAEFGEQEEGVFQASYVDRAVTEYTYGQMYPSSVFMYSIGVDWNSPKIGTTICVTGFNQSTNKFMIVERAVVQREGWTQTAAMSKIIELHRKWKPFAIYVDLGYGSTQIEVMNKYGFDARLDPERGPSHIDSKLPRVIKPFDFGSSIEIRDPFTKELRKKPAKGFLVENAVRRFETGDICIPKEDEVIKKELLGYIIKHVTVTGQVVYTTLDEAIGDHNLDALMLSLVAFTLEKSFIGKPLMNEQIKFTPIDGMSAAVQKEMGLPIPINTPKIIPDTKPDTRDGWKDPKKSPETASSIKLWERPGWSSDTEKPIAQRSIGPGIFKRPSPPGKRGKF